MNYTILGSKTKIAFAFDSTVGKPFVKTPGTIINDDHWRKQGDDETIEQYQKKAQRQVVFELEDGRKHYVSMGKFGDIVVNKLKLAFMKKDKDDPKVFNITGAVPANWQVTSVKSGKSTETVLELA